MSEASYYCAGANAADELAEKLSTSSSSSVSVATQTDPNLIDKLIDNRQPGQPAEEVDLYQEYVRSAQCAQFWPLDKNPIRSLVPAMINVDLPEQYLKNESLMFDLVQAITNNSKLVDLLAKYIHHIVPNVIISKRIDLIPLITCTIRVCRDTNEQERLLSLLFNLIKRPNEEQRRMILSGIIVVLQVSPDQSSSLLLPNLWEHVNDKFPERRILLAESCATLAHYVRPIMRSNLVLSILIQLLKDKNGAVRSAACKSFACLLTLIMDRNDEIFDACLSATEDIIQDVLQQTPVNFCEFRHELEQMRHCALETVYPLMCMWAVKLNRFKLDVAEFYLLKAQKFLQSLLQQHQNCKPLPAAPATDKSCARRHSSYIGNPASCHQQQAGGGLINSTIKATATLQQQAQQQQANLVDVSANSSLLTSQRAVGAYMKMLDYLIPFVFSDAINGCAWLSKSNLHLQPAGEQINAQAPLDFDSEPNNRSPASAQVNHPDHCERRNLGNDCYATTDTSQLLFDRPIKYANKLLNPTLIIDESAVIAFHDQLEREHNSIESLDWILSSFLQKFLTIVAHLSNRNFLTIMSGNSTSSSNTNRDPNNNSPTNHYQTGAGPGTGTGSDTDLIRDFLNSSISSTRQLCLLFGKHLTRNKIRPLIKSFVQQNNIPAIFSIYIASLTSFEPIEQQEFEEIVNCIRLNLNMAELARSDVEVLAITIKTIATSPEQIQSPSTRQKFLAYVLDALVNCSNSAQLNPTQPTANQQIKTSSQSIKRQFQLKKSQSISGNRVELQRQQAQMKEFILIIFRHILSCLIDPALRPLDWAHILVTKFLPLLISLANDPTDVYVCTYARLMCAQLVETFDTYLNSPKMTKQLADSILPALLSLKTLTQQLKSSNLNRQIELLRQELEEKFFKDDNNNNLIAAPEAPSSQANNHLQ